MVTQRHLFITALTVSAGVLGACSSTPTTVAQTVEDIVDASGMTQVARITTTLAKDGPRTEVVTIRDGAYTEWKWRPATGEAVDMGDPTFSFIEGSFDVNSIDLAQLEEDMLSVPECDEPRAEVKLIGTHVVESVNCGLLEAPITKRIDGQPVETIPGGDLQAAIDQLREDIALVDGTEISSARIVMDSDEPWTAVTVTSPTMDYSNGTQCQFTVEHSHRGLNWGCEEGREGISADVIDPEIITKIWQAEGSPASGWNVELLTDDEPSWLARSGEASNWYDTEGNLLD